MPTHHFKILSQDQRARCGVLYTPHGRINTPVFMPVGTQACVKSLSPDDLYEMQAEIILGNAYHLYLRPGDELIRSLKGLHSFSGWKRPILTDSGGYQVFSLAGLRKLTENGVEFQSHIDGSRHLFTPEKVIQIQNNLGSDIMMPLDECVSYDMERTYTEKSVQLTFNWAQRSLEEHQKGLREQLLFGIVQGGFYKDLRTRSAEQLSSLEFDGLAIGGLSVGEPKKAMLEILNHTAGLLPEEKPRYLMGVGSPMDILRGIKQGIDMFDCVLPTRNARNGTLFSSQGKINIKRQEFKEDPNPVDPYCSCYACRNFSRAYLRHLYISKELLAYRLNSIHNLHFFLELVHQARKAIQKQELDSLIRHYAMFYVD